MKQYITAARVRTILADAITDADAAAALRAHNIRYHYSTTGGALHIQIPARSGIIRVYRSGSTSAPFGISAAVSAPIWYRMPALHKND